MKHLKLFALLILGSMLAVSCYKNPNTEELSYDLVVATDFDDEADFSSYMTYHISDTIINISNKPNDSILVGAVADQIVDRIKEHMNQRGYVFVEKDQDPDLGLMTTIIQNKNLGQVCYGWWWGYPGYYPPYWWGYPGYGYYYPFCSYYSYEIGTLNVEMFDLKNAEENQNIRAIWNDVNFGVMSKYEQTNVNRALESIDQAFDQSPYIQN